MIGWFHQGLNDLILIWFWIFCKVDAGTQAAALQQFQTMIGKLKKSKIDLTFSTLILGTGQLSLTDLNGNALDVPSQCVNNCPVEIIGKNYWDKNTDWYIEFIL